YGGESAGSRATAAAATTAGATTATTAAATSKAQHPLHHGGRYRLDATEHLSPRPDGGGDAGHPPHRRRRRDLHGLRRHAELHLRPQRILYRHVSGAHRHDPAAPAR